MESVNRINWHVYNLVGHVKDLSGMLMVIENH